jgi:hypothetical protein
MCACARDCSITIASTSMIDKYVSLFNIGLQNTSVYRWNF